MISKLRSAVENIDLNRWLAVASPCSDLECPICLEEMKPPMRIWQCLSGETQKKILTLSGGYKENYSVQINLVYDFVTFFVRTSPISSVVENIH